MSGPFYKIHGRHSKGNESLPGDGIMFHLDAPGETTPPCCYKECSKVREESGANNKWVEKMQKICSQTK